MSWVVDTCVLIDVLEDDPSFGKMSAMCLQNMLKDGLVVAPISYIVAHRGSARKIRSVTHFVPVTLNRSEDHGLPGILKHIF